MITFKGNLEDNLKLYSEWILLHIENQIVITAYIL